MELQYENDWWLSNSHRDNPDSLPSFLGENEAKKGCTITQIGDNVFAAVLWVFIIYILLFLYDYINVDSVYLLVLFYITSKLSVSFYLLKWKKERSGKKAGGEALEKLEKQLRERAETLGLSVEQKSKAMKQRDRKVSFTVFAF